MHRPEPGTTALLLRLEEVEEKLARHERRRRRAGVALVALVALALGGTAAAQPGVTSLHVFRADTPARASQVNQNFALLQTWITQKVGPVSSLDISARDGTLIEGGLTSACTTAGGGSAGCVMAGSAPFSRVSSDSFHTNGTGFGQLWLEGTYIDANQRIYIGTGVAGGQSAQPVTMSTLDVDGNLGFGSTSRQMINLYSTGYGIGVQTDTQYFRTARNFAWYRNGSHSGTVLDAGGGGTTIMTAVPDATGGQVNAKTWSNASQGDTVTIPEADVIRFCADEDGCRVILAMTNFDGQGRTASRSTHFYYNPTNGTWRDQAGDTAGTTGNGTVEHVEISWSCYFTDGSYSSSVGSDGNRNFGILNWDQYVGETCRLTLID